MNSLAPNKEKLVRGLLHLAFLVALWALMVWGRWHSIIYPFPLNPDEAQAGANALRILKHGISWDAVDGSTNGPLNFLILCWPKLIGLSINFFTIRLTALSLLALALLFVYLITLSVSGSFLAALVGFIFAFFYAFAINNDFLHYSSELLPTTISIISAWFFIASCKDERGFEPNKLFIILSGFLLGAIPFAKLQAAPMAAAIILVQASSIIVSKSPIKNLTLFAVSGSIASLTYLGPLFFNGEFHHFLNSYILWLPIYLSPMSSSLGFIQMILSDSLLASVFVVVICLLAIFSIKNENDVELGRRRPIVFYFIFLLFAASVYSVVRPGRGFTHYLNLVIPPALLFVGYLGAKNRFSSNSWSFKLICILPVAYFLCFSPQVISRPPVTQTAKKALQSPQLFSYLLTRPGESLFVWGWSAHWYIYSGLVPAARDANIFSQIYKSPLTNYFRTRQASDVKRSNPPYIIDGVAGSSFSFNNNEIHGLTTFKELMPYVRQRFSQIHGVEQDLSCARTYLRNDRFQELDSKRIKFKSIKGSAEFSPEYSAQNLDDYSVTEDTCKDYWLLPNTWGGYVDIELEERVGVGTILILNTRNGTWLDRAMGDVRIELRDGTAVRKSLTVGVEEYPRWTVVRLDQEVVADSMRIEALTYLGKGAGLNEIKVFRAGLTF